VTCREAPEIGEPGSRWLISPEYYKLTRMQLPPYPPPHVVNKKKEKEWGAGRQGCSAGRRVARRSWDWDKPFDEAPFDEAQGKQGRQDKSVP